MKLPIFEPKTRIKSVRFDEKTLSKIDDYCKKYHYSFSNFILLAVYKFFAKGNDKFQRKTKEEFNAKRKSERLTVWLNYETQKNVEKACKFYQRSYSDFVRLAIQYFLEENDENKIFERDRKFKLNLIFQFKKCGNNINQISHNLNTKLSENNNNYNNEFLLKETKEELKNMVNKITELEELVYKRM